MSSGDESSFIVFGIGLGTGAVLTILGMVGAWLKWRMDRSHESK